LLMGGRSQAAIDRTVKYADGWTAGGGGAEAYALTAKAVTEACLAAGRKDHLRVQASETCSLLPGAEETMKAQISTAFATEPVQLERRLRTAIYNEDRSKAAIDAYGEAGCEELIISISKPDFDQMDRLARIAL